LSGTPLARPAVWRLWWSFTWRQAAAYCAAAGVMWASFGALKWAGVPPIRLLEAYPWLTVAAVVFSGYEACRRLFSVYDIRLHGAHADEQNHRNRR
jgi:hypothetical protein